LPVTDLHRSENIMGTPITVDIVDGPPDAEQLAAAVFDWFREIDARFSPARSDSEVARIDRGELALEHASDDVRHVFNACQVMWAATGGYFDIQATHKLDPSGYVKGWAAQEASDRLLGAGAPNHRVKAGGDVRVRGLSPDGGPWQVSVPHPLERHKVAWVLVGSDLSVATTAIHERGRHVVDPFTGVPCSDLVSVTIVGPELGNADAYATAAMAMGARSLEWLTGLAVTTGYESAVMMEDGRTFRSAGLPAAVDAV
jgi:thiamine biosynthesis lipoprotein